MERIEGKAIICGCAVLITWDEYKEADGYFLLTRDAYGIYKQFADVKETKYCMNLAVARGHYGLIVAPYVECAGEKHVLIQSKNIEMPEIRSEAMQVRSLQSYYGVTLSWIDEATMKGNYYVWRVRKNSYEVVGYVEEYQITLNDVRDGDKFVVASICSGKDGNTEVIKLSEEYEYIAESKDESEHKEIAVSVVVPIYNNERYVSRCIDSILLSVLPNIEIILVDDGSKDGTAEIVDWYQSQYPNKIVVIHQENKGLSMARNAGTLIARGEYLAYVDSDDMVHPQMYELMYEDISKLDCDVAVAQYFRYSAKNGRILRYPLPKEEHKAYEIDELLKRIYSEGFGTVAVWNKIYRTSLVKEHLTPKMLNEDTAWTPYVLSYAKTFCFVKKPLYCWDRRVECTTVTLSNELTAQNPNDKYQTRRASFEYFLQNGNQEKIDCLSYCAVKRIIQCAEKYPKKNCANPYYEYVKELEERYCLSKNPFLAEDAEYMPKVKEILKM